MLAFLSFFEELEVDEQPTEEAARPAHARRPGDDGRPDGPAATAARRGGLQRLPARDPPARAGLVAVVIR